MLKSDDLINKVKSYNKFLNPETLDKAYNFAVKAHENQKRHSGDPYVIHPVAVANILTELKLDSATIATGLLHDTIEDTHATYQTIKDEFGQEVADLVEGVTKISELENQATANSRAENFRKLIIATSKDIRVLLVKIADRLHNMRTISSIDKIEKRERIAKETMEIYSPLADRMGMNRIRDELEDLSFEVLNPNARKLIKDRLDKIKENNLISFNAVAEEFTKLLQDHGLVARIFGREKTPFSLWRKMQNKRISLEQITDIMGFRIILDDISACYKSLGIFHNKWNCIPGKFKDYISSPKINKYQSLHTAIIGPNQRPIEIQLRTMQMHEFAQRGVASHWKYKSSEKFNSLTWKEYDWLADLVEIIEKNQNPEDFYEYTKLQMFHENVFCFTPKGSVIKLPKDATPIDFAYAVHTQIGDTAIGSEINGKDSPLQSTLRNGDVVKIITSKRVSPSLHWLSLSKTGKARAAIRRYWQYKENTKSIKTKRYNTTLWISLTDQPGKLGDVTTMIGLNNVNISSVEMVEKTKKTINFRFNLIIHDLKNFTKLISELKQKEYNFKIIRHKNKKYAFFKRLFGGFKKN
ncbi:MAG: RelA/SpoT family protein [Candidatus Pelagibacter sp.]|jgi:RelA/SpoT family (p)ppGpp synthetase|nr:MAG: bifunctional (p)ppGpp synthetase/guanosine-3',5'-bis(diphosphate) 3'-pyrophosphohydrolase [Pelagibacterales bacterium]|tara:strand:+ start:1317 stop:3062 length:1746 start_codon:yes stop_codon:yes gene_type:complete